MNSPQHILFLEDDDITNYYTQFLLKDLGCTAKVHYATNGLEALAYLKECVQQQTWPDLILVDINMPVLDGFGFLQQYEQHHATTLDSTRIYMLTSSEHPRDRERSRSFPCVTGYLTKPFDREKWIACTSQPDQDLGLKKQA